MTNTDASVFSDAELRSVVASMERQIAAHDEQHAADARTIHDLRDEIAALRRIVAAQARK
jgi:hypothetical protein